MRTTLIKLIQLLDGTPAVYGKRQAGQSVVELALITPILIILLAGLIEIGWFANNYLTLLDVTRAGARRGTVLQDQQSPLFWEDQYSYVPYQELVDTGFALYAMPNGTVTLPASTDHPSGEVVNYGTDVNRYRYRWRAEQTGDPTVTGNFGPYACSTNWVPERTFYSEVVCTMIASLDPLTLNPDNGIDDIIVTGYSLQLVDFAAHPTYMPDFYKLDVDGDGDVNEPQLVVAGRFPTNANECDVQDSGGTPVMSVRAGDGRDPFDINNNSKRDVSVVDGGSDIFTELDGYDQRFANAANVAEAEKQIGFSLTGNHKISGTFCIGSEWTMQQMAELVNIPRYGLTNADGFSEKKVLPSAGIVLVEMYWEHEMLLKIPILSPVYSAVGNDDGKMVIYVWAAFPLPTVQPYIIFP